MGVGPRGCFLRKGGQCGSGASSSSDKTALWLRGIVRPKSSSPLRSKLHALATQILHDTQQTRPNPTPSSSSSVPGANAGPPQRGAHSKRGMKAGFLPFPTLTREQKSFNSREGRPRPHRRSLASPGRLLTLGPKAGSTASFRRPLLRTRSRLSEGIDTRGTTPAPGLRGLCQAAVPPRRAHTPRTSCPLPPDLCGPAPTPAPPPASVPLPVAGSNAFSVPEASAGSTRAPPR